MTTEDTTLYVVIANMLLTPFLQYLLHSRCSQVDICCMHCKRDVIKSKEELESEV